MNSTMNQRMARVFGGFCAAFVGVVVLLTWWQIIAAGDLRQRNGNQQTAYYEQRVERGLIRSSEGTVIAARRKSTSPNGDDVWLRAYPQGSLAAHIVGYSTIAKSRTGVERQWNDVLTGSTRDLGSIVGLLDGDDTAIGDDITLTIRATAQRVAEDALDGQRGAVVALDPKTGRVLVAASAPTFSPSKVEGDFASITATPGSPLRNRATTGDYAPGSTFKLVTAAAALADGIDPEQTFPGGSSVDVEFDSISNTGGASYGSHDLETALTNSINTTFARLGEQLGKDKLRAQMEAFGFYSTPPLEGLPSSELRTSGLYDGRRLLPESAPVDTARLAIGQERLAVTPLQMAMVTAGIANDGVVMRPYVVDKVTRRGGKVVERGRPEEYKRAMEPGDARALAKMMESVVTTGTGQLAAIDGVDVGGKSGTADSTDGNQVWFVAFAPADDPRVAVAVTIEGQSEGTFGGQLAAPIARDVMEAVL